MSFFESDVYSKSLIFSLSLLFTSVLTWMITKTTPRTQRRKHTLLLISINKWVGILGGIGLLGLLLSLLEE